MPDLKKVLDTLSEFTLLKYFPGEPAARLALAKLVLQMADTHEQVEWLVTRTMSVCNEWPGPLVLRQIFCSRFKPRDGIEAGATQMFPEGLPPESRPARTIALPPGEVRQTLDAGLEKGLQLAAEAKGFNGPPVDSIDYAHLEELRRARLRKQHRDVMEAMGLRPITQEDIDRAVQEARAKGRDGTS